MINFYLKWCYKNNLWQCFVVSKMNIKMELLLALNISTANKWTTQYFYGLVSFLIPLKSFCFADSRTLYSAFHLAIGKFGCKYKVNALRKRRWGCLFIFIGPIHAKRKVTLIDIFTYRIICQNNTNITLYLL